MVAGIIVLRVEGKAAYATAFSATGLIVNILFDFIFIMILKMNVIGAAIASVMGQIVTAMVYY
jgi:Na+-driven multidrug efflux pump